MFRCKLLLFTAVYKALTLRCLLARELCFWQRRPYDKPMEGTIENQDSTSKIRDIKDLRLRKSAYASFHYCDAGCLGLAIGVVSWAVTTAVCFQLGLRENLSLRPVFYGRDRNARHTAIPAVPAISKDHGLSIKSKRRSSRPRANPTVTHLQIGASQPSSSANGPNIQSTTHLGNPSSSSSRVVISLNRT